MIKAGIAEYAAILTQMAGTTISGFEPTATVVVIVAGIAFLLWLVVYKL